MEQNILNTILKNTYTLTGLRHRVRILKNYLVNKIFAQSSQTEIELSVEDSTWLNSLGEDFFLSFNKDNTYPVFSELEQSLDKISSLNIYLPFQINDQIQAQIGEFLRKTFGKTILFDIKFDPLLLAGCALAWQGVYKDYSLRQRIKDNRQYILENFKKYLK